jgi:hypothetical protein
VNLKNAFKFKKGVNMESELVVVTDMGLFKSYLLNRDEMSDKPSVELVRSFETELHQKFSENLSDKAGRFLGNPTLSCARAYGEPHDIQIERKRRTIKQIAREISQLIDKFGVRRWFFAGSKEVYLSILKDLDAEIKEKLKMSLNRDLTKSSKAELSQLFGSFMLSPIPIQPKFSIPRNPSNDKVNR